MNNKVIELALKRYGEGNGGRTFPWCAAFLNEILEEAGYKPTGSLMARSFLNYGRKTDTPELGDIVILWRVAYDSAFGHAGFFIKENANWVWILGGNEDDMVKIKPYPKWQLLDYRNINA